MIADETSDPILRSVSRLPVLAPNEDRAKRLRARCRARLVQPATAPRRRYGPALLAGMCLLYLSAVVVDVLRLAFLKHP